MNPSQKTGLKNCQVGTAYLLILTQEDTMQTTTTATVATTANDDIHAFTGPTRLASCLAPVWV